MSGNTEENKIISMRLPVKLIDKIEKEASETSRDRTKMVIHIINTYFKLKDNNF